MDSQNPGISLRNLLLVAASSLGGLAAVATIHAAFVVPSLLHRASEMMDDKIVKHTGRPHPGAVVREEVHLIYGRIDRLETSLNKRLDGIDADLKALRDRSP